MAETLPTPRARPRPPISVPAPSNAETPSALHFSVVDTPDDPNWDAFLARAPGGHYVQSSLWARIKETQGWQTRRLVARNDRGAIMAGAQFLLKPIPVVGAIAVAYKAPVVATPEAGLEARVVAELHRVVRRLGVVYCSIQPAEGGERVAAQLQAVGYRPAPGLGHTPVTTVIDLTQDGDQIFQRIHKKARRTLRVAQREGVSMREGHAADLELFHRLLVDASRRRNFDTHPLEFFEHLWRTGAPHGQVKLFFAQIAGETIATEIALAIGETLYGFKAAWTGAYEKLRPNGLLDWEIIRWAKAHGFRRYDFVGIDSTHELAFKLATGELPREYLQGVYNFKLSFGGDVIYSPIAYEYVPNPALRALYSAFWRNERLDWPKHTASLLLRGMRQAT